MAEALGEVKGFIESLRDEGVETLVDKKQQAEAMRWRVTALKYKANAVAILNALASSGIALPEEVEEAMLKAWMSLDGDD
jgi:hypothetical protein